VLQDQRGLGVAGAAGLDDVSEFAAGIHDHESYPYHLGMATAGDPRRPAATGDRALSPLSLGSPLTERILDRLGGPRWLWSVAWGATALVTPAVLLTLLVISGTSDRVTSVAGLFLSQGVVAYVIVLVLWGMGRMARDVRALEPELARLTYGTSPGRQAPAIVSVAGPVLLTAVVVVVNGAGLWDRYGALVMLILVPFVFVYILPIMSFVWTYLALLVSLDRLGRSRLALDLFPQDRTLGLGPVGALAFTGFALLFAAAIPILVTNSQNPSTVVVDLVVVIVSVLAFFLSMWRLHGQMASAKARYLAETRALYAAAYEPLRTARTVATLAAQSALLGTAQGLVERAESILAWPLEERLLATVISIGVGVVISLIVRFVLLAAGL
jgi:hypothetical protein